MEEESKIALECLLRNGPILNEWYSYQCVKFNELYESATSLGKSEQIKQKHFTEFHILFHAYLTSVPFMESVHSLVSDKYKCESVMKQILTSVLFIIQRNLLKEKTSAVQTEACSIFINPSQSTKVSLAGEGKIRYVGGYVIAKTRFHLNKRLRNTLFVPGMEEEMNDIQTQLSIVNTFIVSSSELHDITYYDETLQETSRKQSISDGLVNIHDKVF